MNEELKNIFNIAGIPFEELDEINGLFIEREILLNDKKYESVKNKIPELKKSANLTLRKKSGGVSPVRTLTAKVC